MDTYKDVRQDIANLRNELNGLRSELYEFNRSITEIDGQVGRLLSDYSSEKQTRKESNDRIYKGLKELDVLIRGERGDNGLSSRVRTLENAYRAEMKQSAHRFNRIVSVTAIVISSMSLVAMIYFKSVENNEKAEVKIHSEKN